MKKEIQPNRIQIIKMALAIRDAYFEFDQEDWCKWTDHRVSCGKCKGCIQYSNLFKVYKIAENFLPKRLLGYKIKGG